MKPKWVATRYAGKFKALLLMSLILVVISCDKSDDLDTVGNESPIQNESPPDETPPDEESPSDNEPPTDDESNIVYTDIEPDFTGQNLIDYYDLDLNNDQIVDFTVWSGDWDGWQVLMIGSNPIIENGVISVQPWYTNVVPIDGGKEIYNPGGYRNGEYFASGGFFTVGDCHAGEPGCFYYWKDKIDKYLGLRFFIKGQPHYGWARLDITSFTQWVIKDYAYNATPNKPILAGQTE